jgi:hypothetical protein
MRSSLPLREESTPLWEEEHKRRETGSQARISIQCASPSRSVTITLYSLFCVRMGNGVRGEENEEEVYYPGVFLAYKDIETHRGRHCEGNARGINPTFRSHAPRSQAPRGSRVS